LLPSMVQWHAFLRRRRLLVKVFGWSHAVEDEDIEAWDGGQRLARGANIRYRKQFHRMRTVLRTWRDWTTHVLLQRWKHRSIASLRRLSLLRKNDKCVL
jgi:hypothetical protein